MEVCSNFTRKHGLHFTPFASQIQVFKFFMPTTSWSARSKNLLNDLPILTLSSGNVRNSSLYGDRANFFSTYLKTENRHGTIGSISTPFALASRSLARKMLMKHLTLLDLTIHRFEDLEDPAWIEYLLTKRVTTQLGTQ